MAIIATKSPTMAIKFPQLNSFFESALETVTWLLIVPLVPIGALMDEFETLILFVTLGSSDIRSVLQSILLS